MSTYVGFQDLSNFPNFPFEIGIDLTYRCNNNCRHCWVCLPQDSKEKELSFEEIKKIVDEAGNLGCRRWWISGGEPLLRKDFTEIFDYITKNSKFYSINTNAALITPRIAKLMKRKGSKMLALYGSTDKIHDHITRNPGSFEATMRGFKYMQEAGAGFIVQIIPMRDNYHQLQDMIRLAESLGRPFRMGAFFLHGSAYSDPKKNEEIAKQRLSACEAIVFDNPDLSFEEHCLGNHDIQKSLWPWQKRGNKYLFGYCIAARRRFHIDPYGKMSFCFLIKDPRLRYDLRKASFKNFFEEGLIAFAKKVKVNEEYKTNCGSCELRKDCFLCPAYAYLEHRRYSSKIDYFCAMAKEKKRYKENWYRKHRRYYQIAETTICIDSDVSIDNHTFHSKFKVFETEVPGKDVTAIRHHFSLPDLKEKDLGQEVYRKPPWAIYKKDDSWIYSLVSGSAERLQCLAVFNQNYTRARIYHKTARIFLKGGLHSLTSFPTDQILLAQLLADRHGCILHSCGVSIGAKGLLFAGSSGAGKSTIASLLKKRNARILCDDRMIIRNHNPEGFKIYGTWSNGDIADVFGGSASLRAILFLKKSKENKIIPINDEREITRQLLSCVIRPLVTVDWWEKTLDLVEEISRKVPCYTLKFDKSIAAAGMIEEL